MVLSHPDLTPLSSEIIRCAITVHSDLGPSLLEDIYEECLELELSDAGLHVEAQAAVPGVIKGRDSRRAIVPILSSIDGSLSRSNRWKS
jgi:GxxExxY protein